MTEWAGCSRAESAERRRNFLGQKNRSTYFFFIPVCVNPLSRKRQPPLERWVAVALRAWCLHQCVKFKVFFHAVAEAGHDGEGFALKVGDFDVAVG